MTMNIVCIGVGFFLLLFSSCSTNDDKSKSPTSVHEVRDSINRVVERWGNSRAVDDDVNFRYFFYYDSNNLLVNERRYFLDQENVDCIIKDSAIYDDLYYEYKLQQDKYILTQTKFYAPQYDDNGKYLGRELYFIKDEITG